VRTNVYIMVRRLYELDICTQTTSSEVHSSTPPPTETNALTCGLYRLLRQHPMAPVRHAAHDLHVHPHRALRALTVRCIPAEGEARERVRGRGRMPLLLELAAHRGPLFAVGVACGHMLT
jgi:hypothetical protein